MKKVLVTGGATGIGALICEQFAKEGYLVLLHYFKSKEQAVNLQKKINSNRGMCEIFYADFSNAQDINDMFLNIYKDFSVVDVLINNAGVTQHKMFLDSKEDDWQEIFNINLFSTFLCCKKILPNMIKHKKGKIINISSVWGEVGACCEVLYSSSKAAIIGFTKALSKEVASCGINVNCIAPGVIKTDMINDLSDCEIKDLINNIPCGRIGTPKDVANAALFLADDDKSSYINGVVLDVGGGFFR